MADATLVGFNLQAIIDEANVQSSTNRALRYNQLVAQQLGTATFKIVVGGTTVYSAAMQAAMTASSDGVVFPASFQEPPAVNAAASLTGTNAVVKLDSLSNPGTSITVPCRVGGGIGFPLNFSASLDGVKAIRPSGTVKLTPPTTLSTAEPSGGTWDDARINTAIASATASSGSHVNKFVVSGQNNPNGSGGYRNGQATRDLGGIMRYNPPGWWPMPNDPNRWYPWAEMWGYVGHAYGSTGVTGIDIRNCTIQVLYRNATAWEVIVRGMYQIGWRPQWEIDYGNYPRDQAEVAVPYYETDFPNTGTLVIPADPNNMGYGCHFTWTRYEIPNPQNVEGLMFSCEIKRSARSAAGSTGVFHLSMDPKPTAGYTNNKTELNLPYWIDSGFSKTFTVTSEWQSVFMSNIAKTSSINEREYDRARLFQARPQY